jgi:CheY-like chemotaxis protein
MEQILFIDDEAFFSTRYIEELEKNYRVAFCESAIEAIRLIREIDEFRAIILDIQMPPPQGISPQVTNDGVDTGLWLLKEVREIIIQRPLPVVILTNRIPHIVENGVIRLVFPEQLIEVRQKTDTTTKKLVERVGVMTLRWSRR